MIRTSLLGVVVASMALAQPGGSPHTPPANGPRRADPAWVALRDVTVHVKPGEVIEHATVVMRDGVIQAVMPGEGSPFPLGPRVVQGAGLHVYPAFIDAFVEVDAPAPAAGAAGVHWNALVTPQRRAVDGAGVDEATRDSLRKLGFGAAAISPRGGMFRGTAAVVSLAQASDDASISRPPVYRADAYQAVAFETGRGGYPGSLMGSIALFRQTLSDADYLDGLPEGPARNAALQNDGCLGALAKKFDAVTPLVWDVQDELDAMRAAKVAREFGRRAILLGSGAEFRRLDAIKEDGHSFILPLNFPRQPDVSTLGKVEGVELRDLMTWEQAPTNPRRMAKAGVTFALTTSKARDRGLFSENLRKAITAGLTEEQALAALTTVPAKMLMVEEQLGTVEVGKRANLIVADGPIFAKETKLRAVYVDGKPHEMYTPPEKLEGEWAVEIPGAPAAERKIVIEKGNAVTVWRDGKTSKASRVTVEGGRLSYTFDHEPLDGQVGVYAMTAAIERGADGKAFRLAGQGLRAGGQAFAWSATRNPPSLEGMWAFNLNMPRIAPETVSVLTVKADGTAAWLVRDGGEMPATITREGEVVTITADRAAVGGEGSLVIAGAFDFEADPVTFSGRSMGNEATPAVYAAKRTAPMGTWKVTEFDGKSREAGEGITIEVRKDGVTMTVGKPNDAEGKAQKAAVVRGEDVKVEGRVVTFTHDLKELGGEGRATVTLTAFGDELTGESVYADGTKRAIAAEREPPKKTDADDAEWAKDIPEALPMPFGPYGFEALPPQGTFVLTNATLWTNTAQGVSKNATMVIAKGKIVAVFPEGDFGFAIPGGETPITIDCSGKHITPGIIDAHSHTGISRGVNEGGQAITAECRIQDVTNPDTTNWYWQLAGGVTTVLNLHGSANAIGGQSQTNKVRWGAARPDDLHFEGSKPGIKFALGENPRGANSGGAREGPARYPQTRMGVEMLIRDRFTAAKEYAEAMRHAKAAPLGGVLASAAGGLAGMHPGQGVRRDLELEALAEILAGERLVHCHSYRQDEILMLCMVAKDFNFKIGTFQHILEGYKVADYVRDYSGGGSGFSDWWAYKIEVQDAIPQGLPLMAMVGATVSFNSDSDELARRLNVEAGKAVKYADLPEEDALKFVTLNPAKQLGVDGRVGTLEVGKDADVAVWNGHPMSSMSKCERTFVDGRQLFSLEEDAKHRERIQKERSRLIQKILAEPKRAGAGGGDGDRPAGAAEGGRRRPGGRRPPNLSEGDFSLDGLSDDEAAKVREYYLDLYYRGKTPNQPGVCGCGLEHW